MTITRKTSTQYRNAEARSADREKRTVDLVWSTGAAVLRRSYEGPYWEELSLDTKHVRLGRLNNRAPFLRDHNKASIDNVLGAIEPGTAKVDGKQGIATVRFPQTGVDPEADMVFEK